MMNIIFRSGLGSDAPELTKIAFAAKRHWDYPEEWIDLWADESAAFAGSKCRKRRLTNRFSGHPWR
jgi:hypothetical protein